jgi:hypothetical protein
LSSPSLLSNCFALPSNGLHPTMIIVSSSKAGFHERQLQELIKVLISPN